MDNFEKYISSRLQNDKLPFHADPAIRNRLMYQMQLKFSRSTLHKNQILPFVGLLFSPKLLVWKLGIVAVLVLISVSSNYYNNQNINAVLATDSTRMISSVDSTSIQLKDTLSFN